MPSINSFLMSSYIAALTKFINQQRRIFYLLLLLFIARVASSFWIPLNDTTEARYAEMARYMLSSGNWAMPMMNHDVFWGKPPLAFWLSAFSMKLFGVNAFAVRLPALLLSIGMIGLIKPLARYARIPFSLYALLLTANVFFFINAGTVMTEPVLLFSLTLSMSSCWMAMTQNQPFYGYLFFVGLGLGLLAKGPLSLVLIGGALFIWAVWNKQWQALFHRLPWVFGSILMLAIPLPWYLLAEHKTPGFLNYFIIGEHIKRYLQPGWSGDKYGYVHSVPYGTIWIYALLAALPFLFFVLACIDRKSWTTIRQAYKAKTALGSWRRYLLSWLLFPLCFFSLARNIIYPYVFPILVPMSLLLADVIHQNHWQIKTPKLLHRLAFMTAGIALCITSLFYFFPNKLSASQAAVIAFWKTQPAVSSESTLHYWSMHPPPFSAQFYAQGKVHSITNAFLLCHFLDDKQLDYLVVPLQEQYPLPPCAAQKLIKLNAVTVGKHLYVFYSRK